MKEWSLRPRLLVNVNSRSGCQSRLATRAACKLVSAVHLPDEGSMRPSSAGLTALSQFTTTVLPFAWTPE